MPGLATHVPALRALEYYARAYRRTWRATVVSSVVSPLFFLAALGIGLGSLVKHSHGTVSGVDYVVFLAPGLLAANSMQTAVGESTWPVLASIKWSRLYHAMLSTPLRVGDVLAGNLGWIAVRLTISATAFAVVATPFGVWHSPLVLLAIPAAALTGIAFAAPVMAVSARLDNDSGFVLIFRLGVIPLFLFSGTFFPISQLPAVLRWLAPVSPLWHGVTLCRALALGRAPLAASLGHVAYLVLWVVVGAALALRSFRARLAT